VVIGAARNLTLSPESGSTSSTLHSVESSPSSMFRMPARAPDQKDWTSDDREECEACQMQFSFVRPLEQSLFITDCLAVFLLTYFKG